MLILSPARLEPLFPARPGLLPGTIRSDQKESPAGNWPAKDRQKRTKIVKIQLLAAAVNWLNPRLAMAMDIPFMSLVALNPATFLLPPEVMTGLSMVAMMG